MTKAEMFIAVYAETMKFVVSHPDSVWQDGYGHTINGTKWAYNEALFVVESLVYKGWVE